MVQQLARSSCCKRYKITVREDKLNSLQTPFYVLNYWVLVTHFPYYARALKSPQKFRTLSFSSANFLGSWWYTSLFSLKTKILLWNMDLLINFLVKNIRVPFFHCNVGMYNFSQTVLFSFLRRPFPPGWGGFVTVVSGTASLAELWTLCSMPIVNFFWL